MKFYKRLPIHRKDPMSDRFAVEANDQITTTTPVGMQMPRGKTTQRSSTPANGELRFNSDIGTTGELEVFIVDHWEIVKTNRHATVTQQQFDNGDYADTYFGPLQYDISPTRPENLTVFVENVPQIANTNFTLTSSTFANPITASTQLFLEAGAGDTVLFVDSVADFNPGNIIIGNNIVAYTRVVDTSATDLTITINNGVSGVVTPGTVLTTIFGPGTYVHFLGDSLPVPHKPVITLLGLDGYCPPFEV